MKTIRMMVLALLMTAQGLAWGGFDEGLDALHHGQYEAALKEWKPLAEQGDVEAQIRLGYLYFDGLGVNQDYKEGVRWFRKAAEQGNAEAQGKIGIAYQLGKGDLPKDYKEAAKWFLKAAEQGAFNRYYNLGFLYENGGYGLPKDYVQAYMWYSLDIPLYRDDFNDIHRIRVMEKMTPAQITEGRQLAKEWIVEHPYPKP
jgi:uncharacterized protein